MATNIPAPLKTADITRFAVRAAQVEKAKPAAAYWCYYYVLDKLLSQGLHKTDDECQAYVVSLMDKVEQMKNEHTEDDAMRDDMAGKAYVEQFGLETFMRADNAMRSSKATKQTADTFQAAYTFLDVLQVWPPVDPDIVSKVKFAKFHAVRIMKAIKAGEDPNASNPVQESDEPAVPALDADDPEVRAITGLGPGPGSDAATPTQPAPPPPIVTNPTDPESFSPHNPPPPQFVDRPPVSPPDHPISLPPYPNEHSSQSTQAMPHHHQHQQAAENFYQSSSHPDVSPLPASDSGGYFPQVPPSENATSPTLPGPPSGIPGAAPVAPTVPSIPPDMTSPVHLGAPSPFANAPGHAGTQYHQQHQQHHYQQQQPPPPPSLRTMDPPVASPVQSYVPAPATEINDEAMARAQKHARFAISALNFEDVGTAVKELKAALADLGHR